MTPKTYARLAGALYLVPMVCGPFSMMYVPSVIVVPGDAAATAAHLLASESLFRLGLLSDLAIVLSEVALTAVLYVVLKPAGQALALTAAFARLAMTVVQAVNLFPQLAALEVAQRDPSLALTMLGVHGQGVHVWEALFALHCIGVGVLVFRAGFFPRVFGVLMALAGFGYGLNGVGNLVAPGGAAVFAAVVAVAALVGEVPFVFWLLIKGVRAPRPA